MPGFIGHVAERYIHLIDKGEIRFEMVFNAYRCAGLEAYPCPAYRVVVVVELQPEIPDCTSLGFLVLDKSCVRCLYDILLYSRIEGIFIKALAVAARRAAA